MELSLVTVKYISFICLPLLVFGFLRLIKWAVMFIKPVKRVWDDIAEKKHGILRKIRHRIPKKIRKPIFWQFSGDGWLAVIAALCFVLEFSGQRQGKSDYILLLWMLPFVFYGLFGKDRAYSGSIFRIVIDLAGIFPLGGLLFLNCRVQHDVYALLQADGQLETAITNTFIILLSWLICSLLLEIYYLCKGRVLKWLEKKQEEEKPDEEKLWFPVPRAGAAIALGSILAVVMIAVFAITIERMGFNAEESTKTILLEYYTGPVHILNVYIMVFLCTALYFLFGPGTGSLLILFCTAFVYISNFIKIKFHGTFFTWFDLLQLKEMLLIGKEYVTTKAMVIAVVIAVLVIAAVIIWHRKVLHFLRIRIKLPGVAAAVCVLGFFVGMIYEDQFKPMDIYPRTWENEDVNVQNNGIMVNLVYNLRTLQETRMARPEGYSETAAKTVEERFDQIGSSATDNIKPDVILILAESLFNLDDVEGITLSEDIDATIDAYSPAKMISPRYGGYTSAMEFEVLTGLSLAYMPNSLTPYTTYFNDPSAEFPCIVREFKNNDYKTLVMHPGLPGFYNRSIVYQNFGFDEYLSIESFDSREENLTENEFFRDVPFGEALIAKMQEQDEPVFLFGISLEGHYVTVDKYTDPPVKATSDILSKDQLHQVEQQASSYYETDKMIANIIAYMKSTTKPTLLYVFGDHLPPLGELQEVGFYNDIYNKYTTSLVMYSNYKNLTVEPEYITPNQIAAQIMEDSGIAHSSYYDYIYSLRDTYPVLQKEFVDVDDNKDLEDYYFLQYDILFGNKYLYQKDAAGK